jgi:hypothetical protein
MRRTKRPLSASLKLSEPLKELSVAGNQNAEGLRPGETVGWPAVLEKGPTEFATMSTSVCFVTPSRGLPPWVRTSAKASTRQRAEQN